MTAPDNDYVTWGAFEWIGGVFIMALAALAGMVLKVLGVRAVDNERLNELKKRQDERHQENKEQLEKINEALQRLTDMLMREGQYRRY